MSNAFLNYGSGGDLEALQNGSTSINVAEIRDQSLIPGLPVAASSTKGLTSRFITTADLDLVPITNPFAGTLEVDNLLSSGLDLNLFASVVGSDVLDLKQVTTALSYDLLTNKTTVAGGLVASNIYATSIVDATATELINIDSDSVDVSSTAFTYNGSQVATLADIDVTTLTSAGGVETLVSDGTGPALAVKGLTAGANITLAGSAGAVIISSAAAAVTTLASAGGASSLVVDGTGPSLSVKGFSAGDGGIIITDLGTAIEVSYDDAPLLAVEDDTQNIIAASTGQTTFAGVLAAAAYQQDEAPIISSGAAVTSSSTPIPACIGFRFTIAQPQLVTYVGVPIVHWPAGNAAITRRCNIWKEGGAFVAGYDLPKTTIIGLYYVLPVSLLLPAGTYRYAIDRGINVLDSSSNANIQFTLDSRVSAVSPATGSAYNVYPSSIGVPIPIIYSGIIFIADQLAGVIEAPILRGPAAGPVVIGSDLDFGNVYNLVRCPNINGIRPSGGVFSQSSGAVLSGVVSAVDLFTLGLGYGTVAVPANTFQPGDAYSLKVGGALTCANADVFTLDLGTTRPALADISLGTFLVAVDGAQVDGWWELEVEFIVRAIGGAGIAAMATNGNYAYYNANSFSKGVGVNTTENTNFRSDIENTLFLKYSTAESSITAFRVSQVILTKLF